MAKQTWDIPVGSVLRRQAVHRDYGGGWQGGISPSGQTPNVLVFSDPNIGAEHGYIYDGWDSRVPGLFHYTGEGQRGNQQMIRGNAAIRDHAKERRSLRLFKGVRGDVRYLGEFTLGDPGYDLRPAHESGGTAIRQVIVFHLQAVEFASDTAGPAHESARTYRRAVATRTKHAELPWSRDPNVLDRSLAAHADTQNALHDFLRAAGVNPWSPRAAEPDFDLAWERRGTVFVCEVKSLPKARAEDRQLRLGIGQVLDYQALMAQRHADVRAVLALERRPRDERWPVLAEAHGITLIWPETFDVLLDWQLV